MDLWVMSPASYRAAPPRVGVKPTVHDFWRCNYHPLSPAGVSAFRVVTADVADYALTCEFAVARVDRIDQSSVFVT